MLSSPEKAKIEALKPREKRLDKLILFMLILAIGVYIAFGFVYSGWRSSLPLPPYDYPPEIDSTIEKANTFSGTLNSDWRAVSYRFEDGIPMLLVPRGCLHVGIDLSYSLEPVEGIWQCFEPFWVDQTEIRQADFRRLGGIQARESTFPGDNRPVETITWTEAHDFCEQLGKRLPTDGEWEFAGRGIEEFLYPWGNDWSEHPYLWRGKWIPSPTGEFWIPDSGITTLDVASDPGAASWIGALDLENNVSEWTNTFSEHSPQDLGKPWAHRIYRGGNWTIPYRELTERHRQTQLADRFDLGFRCARDVN
jgi:formylglycine-generating enzyme